MKRTLPSVQFRLLRCIVRRFSQAPTLDASGEVLSFPPPPRCLRRGQGAECSNRASTMHSNEWCGRAEKGTDMENVMVCAKLQSVKEFDCIKLFFREGCPDVKWVYRGHSNYEWRLQPKIERMKCRIDDILEKERRMIRRFRELLGIYGEDDVYNGDFDFCNDTALVPYLAVMQHYEIPTRLLDFSWSIYVAAYFASLQQLPGDQGKDRAIWVIRLNSLEGWTKGRKEMFQKTTGCSAARLPLLFADKLLQDAEGETALKKRILPLVIEKNNPRMMAQRGLFFMPIYPGHFEIDLQETLGTGFNIYGDSKTFKRLSVCEISKMPPEEVAKIAVLKIEYPDAINGVIVDMLKSKKITHETMFPRMNCIKCKIQKEFCC